jgi:hypothetical protein
MFDDLDARRPHDEPGFDMTEPRSAPAGHATPENAKHDTENVAEASGGFLGAVGGMSVGALGGPVGLVVGGIAGAVGGWWAGKGIASALTEQDDAAFRTDYERSPSRLADRSYENVRPAYVAGHLAGRNPDYAGLEFEAVEDDLQCGWSDQLADQCGAWPSVRGYARTAFERARAGGSGG